MCSKMERSLISSPTSINVWLTCHQDKCCALVDLSVCVTKCRIQMPSPHGLLNKTQRSGEKTLARKEYNLLHISLDCKQRTLSSLHSLQITSAAKSLFKAAEIRYILL